MSALHKILQTHRHRTLQYAAYLSWKKKPDWSQFSFQYGERKQTFGGKWSVSDQLEEEVKLWRITSKTQNSYGPASASARVHVTWILSVLLPFTKKKQQQTNKKTITQFQSQKSQHLYWAWFFCQISRCRESVFGLTEATGIRLSLYTGWICRAPAWYHKNSPYEVAGDMTEFINPFSITT